MISSFEEIKDAKVNQLLEDYIELEKQMKGLFQALTESIDNVPERLDRTISNKLVDLDQAGKVLEQDIEKTKTIIDDQGDKVKNDLNNLTEDIKHKISESFARSLASFENEQKKIVNEYDSIFNRMKKESKPLKIKTLISLSVLAVIILSGLIGVSSWYYAQSTKNDEIYHYAKGYMDIRNLTNDIISESAPSKQTKYRNQLKAIDSKK